MIEVEPDFLQLLARQILRAIDDGGERGVVVDVPFYKIGKFLEIVAGALMHPEILLPPDQLIVIVGNDGMVFRSD